jgi:5-methyltetrahydrofolate--homocysteine methyltransferase
MENYGFRVIDLGRDVPPQVIADTAAREDVRLVGLSALMTTTVPAMAEAIRLLRERKPDARVAVGGAVLTQKYADMIGADYYAENAMATVRYAEKTLK